jgi:4-deoxy-L-threo-5-hexosulose-uronate ketol-isomerase
MMIQPREIGARIAIAPMAAGDRRVLAQVLLPGGRDVRAVEVFDARPVLNRRQEIVTADNSTFRFLRFARIALDTAQGNHDPIVVPDVGDEETLLYVFRGVAEIRAQGETYVLASGDVIYLPIGVGATIRAAADFADVCEYRAADCHTLYPLRVVRHAQIETTPLAATLGTRRPSTERTVFKLVDDNIQCCRLLFGDTFPKGEGAVASYPPHFHGPNGPHGLGLDAKEELYHFRCSTRIDGETPFVLQNCTQPGEPVASYVQVFDEQAVNVTPTFHDTIAPPPVDFMFTWCLAAFTENHRDWSRIHNREGYDDEW